MHTTEIPSPPSAPNPSAHTRPHGQERVFTGTSASGAPTAGPGPVAASIPPPQEVPTVERVAGFSACGVGALGVLAAFQQWIDPGLLRTYPNLIEIPIFGFTLALVSFALVLAGGYHLIDPKQGSTAALFSAWSVWGLTTAGLLAVYTAVIADDEGELGEYMTAGPGFLLAALLLMVGIVTAVPAVVFYARSKGPRAQRVSVQPAPPTAPPSA